ncbi:lytic transglycosylase domain-containing protein [Klebsiella pneumoniae]|uniref:lytic transglycosylase domain-containing protein n=1 Tax=Klebsiella pneumoniae TaxID=573 RepID=UPI001F4B6E70|nr:lytic transglycosylase domain-containing protein [Klebsiella pneumoniae]
MSATVIDALLVTLGLDPSNFTAGTKQVSQDLVLLKKDSEKTAKGMAEDGKKAAEFFRSIKNEMLALIGVTLTLKGLKDVIIDSTHGLADLGRTANLIGESARTVDAWGNAVKGFGGDAKSAQATLLGLEDSITRFQLTGQGNSTIAAFRAMGIQFLDEHGNARKASALLMDIAAYFEKIRATPQQARQLGAALGIDQGTINMLMQGADATRKLIAEKERQSVVTAKNIRDAQNMERAWADLETQWDNTKIVITSALMPQIAQLTALLVDCSSWVTNHKGEISNFFGELPGKIKPVIDDVQKIAEVFGGWENIIKAVIALKLAGWIWGVSKAVLGLLGSLSKIAALAAKNPWFLMLIPSNNTPGTAEEMKRAGGIGSNLPEGALEKLQSGWSVDAEGKWSPPPGGAPAGAAGVSGAFGDLEAKHNLPSGLLSSVMKTESAGNQFAVSPKGAQGPFQLMPATAKWLGLKEGEAFDPEKSADAAARYLSSLLKMFGGDLNTALAAYNWGPGNVSKKGTGNLPSETRSYIKKVTGGLPVGSASRYAFSTPSQQGGARQVHNETHIDTINVQTRATDAEGIAKSLPSAIRANPLIYQADAGMS